MGGVLKTSYQSVSDTGNIQKTRKESGAPPTTEVTGLRAWLRMKCSLSDGISPVRPWHRLCLSLRRS